MQVATNLLLTLLGLCGWIIVLWLVIGTLKNIFFPRPLTPKEKKKRKKQIITNTLITQSSPRSINRR